LTNGSKKKCSVCKIVKSLCDFYKDGNSPDGYSYTCKKCTRKACLKWYHKNKDKARKIQEKYRATPRGKKLAKERTRRFSDKKLGITKKRRGFCELCKTYKKHTEIHHIIPRWFYRDDSEDNQIEVCRKHHHKLEFHIIFFLAGRYNNE